MGIEALLTSQVIGLDAALTGKLNTSGGTVTGQLTNALGTITASTPLTISQTWNNAAVSFNPLLVSVTDTQSASGSLLLDLQVGGSSKFKVGKDGAITALEAKGTGWGIKSAAGLCQLNDGSGTIYAYFGGANSQTQLNGQSIFIQTDSSTHLFATGGTRSFVFEPTSNTTEIRRSTNAQTFRLANTYTSATSFENLQLQWSSNEARIGTSVGSAGGTQRSLVLGAWNSAGTWTAIASIAPSTLTIGPHASRRLFMDTDGSSYFDSTTSGIRLRFNGSNRVICMTDTQVINGLRVLASNEVDGGSLTAGSSTFSGQLTNALGTITASTPATFTQTWNNVATTFTGILANVTDTASASGSLLLDLQVGGTSKFNVRKDGRIKTENSFLTSAGAFISATDGGLGYMYAGYGFSDIGNGYANRGGVCVGRDGVFGFTADNASSPVGGDLFLSRDAADTLSLKRSTSAQVFRIYNTCTSSTSYERGKIAWESNVLRIGTEKGSAGGSARALELQTDGTTRLTISDAGLFTITDALNIAVGTTTGTKIGTATTQKLGFYNATPVDQPDTVADPSGGATQDAEARTAINAIIDRLQELGLIA